MAGLVKATKLAAADCILTAMWMLVTSGMGAASMLVGNYLNWEGDRTPIAYGIILVLNLVFVELSFASGGAAWNPTAPAAFYAAGASEDTFLGLLLLRIPAMAVGAAAGVRAAHELMPGDYKHTLGPGPSLKVHAHHGAVVEGVATFVLTLLMLFTVLRATSNRFLQTPVIFSGAMVLVRLAGSYTGPAMNPSDAFGWAHFRNIHTSLEHIYVYWVMPFVGAILAAVVYRLFLVPATRSPPPDSRQKVE